MAWQHIQGSLLLIFTEIGANRGRQLHSALTRHAENLYSPTNYLQMFWWDIFRCIWWVSI